MGRGSTGNVIAALASFFLPGLGQLIQGRLLAAVVMFLVAGFFWLVGTVLGAVTFGLLGFLVFAGHVLAAFEAAVWRP